MGRNGRFVTRNRANQIGPQITRSNGQAIQAQPPQTTTNGIEARPPRPYNQHTLAGAHQFRHRIHDGLRCTRTGRRAHHDRVAGHNVRHNQLLFGVGIQHQRVGVQRARVDIARVDCRVAFGHDRDRISVAGQGIQNRVVQVRCRTHHVGGNIGQVRNGERRHHVCARNVGNEALQPIQRTIGAERPVVVGQCHERALIQSDSKLCVEFTGQRGIQA